MAADNKLSVGVDLLISHTLFIYDYVIVIILSNQIYNSITEENNL